MIKTKHSDTPTNFFRWKTMNSACYRIYRVTSGMKLSGEVAGIYIGSLRYGDFIPFMGKGKGVITKKLNEYVDYCTLTQTETK